jgi:hypothetical protein
MKSAARTGPGLVSLVALAGLLAWLGCHGATGSGGQPDAASDAILDDAPVAEDGAVLDSAPHDVGPRIVSALLARQFEVHVGGATLSDLGGRLAAVLARNALGDPPGARQFVLRVEEITDSQARLTLGVAERVGTADPPVYRFATDPAPLVVDAWGGIDVYASAAEYWSDSVSQPYQIAVLPDPPDPMSLLIGEPAPSYHLRLTLAFLQDTVDLSLFGASITASTACQVWADGMNLLDYLDDGDVDNSVDTQTCESLVPLDTQWGLDVYLSSFDDVSLIAD